MRRRTDEVLAAGRRRRRSALRLAAATTSAVLAATLLPGAASAASGAPAVGISSCALPRDVALEDLVASRHGSSQLVVGPEDMSYLSSLEARTDPTASNLDGMRVRQQLRHADIALAAPLPSRTSLSQGARSSQERMLRLRVAMQIAADGRSPALADGTTDVPVSTYAQRVRAEVLTWVRMPTWGATAPLSTGSDSMLEAAEVGTAVALGYSLVASTMTSQERTATRAALRDKLLEPACWGYVHGSWQVDATFNWGVVVNAGAAMAALVVADQDQAAAAAVLGQALPRAARAVRATAADGGSSEGPNYAELLQRYLAYLSASMTLTFGEDGRALVPGVPDAARYAVAVTGPSGETFDYSDANGARIMPWLALWNARHGGDPLGDWLGQRLLAQSHPDPLLLLWTRPATKTPATSETVRRTFPTSGVAVMRSSWSDDATWVGLKAGSNAANHSHLDLGSFVLEVDGRRFVDEYGQDSYSLPGYLSGADRFAYWRRSTAGHSTLSRKGANQPATASASLSQPIKLSGGRRQVVTDLTKALSAVAATRRLQLQGETTTVHDTVRFAGPTVVRWSAQTQASVRLERNGRSALLTVDGRTVEARLGSSTPGAFRVTPAPAAPPGGLSNAGWSTLTLDQTTHPAARGTTTAAFVVTFIPR